MAHFLLSLLFVRVLFPTTIDFGAMSPFTFVPAYPLPVYASQWPLPDTTQDSVRGCRLGFAAVAIPGDMVSCAFKAQPAQIRAGPTQALGTSQWNRIEHRLFAFITMNWRGKPLVSHQVIVQLIGATTTETGLKVCCEIVSVSRWPPTELAAWRLGCSGLM